MTDRVTMTVTGRFPERFVGRALARGVRFESIERAGPRKMRLAASAADARVIGALADELGLEARVTDRAGWPVWLARVKARGTLAAGLILCAALVAAFAGRVWRVDLAALDGALPPEGEARLAEWLESEGVRPLMSRNDVDPSLLSARILSAVDNLAYAGVRLKGVRLTVEYRLADAAPDVYRAEAAGCLIAARDAIVTGVEPLAGKACVRPGDAVRAGQLLISGEERIGAEATRAVKALGHVTGRVWFEARREGALVGTTRSRTGRVRTASALRLFSWRLPLTAAEAFACQDEETDFLPVGGLFLPVAIERRTLYEAVDETRPVDRGPLAARLGAEALDAAREGMPAGAVERLCWTEIEEKENALSVRAVIEAEMDIAVQN